MSILIRWVWAREVREHNAHFAGLSGTGYAGFTNCAVIPNLRWAISEMPEVRRCSVEQEQFLPALARCWGVFPAALDRPRSVSLGPAAVGMAH